MPQLQIRRPGLLRQLHTTELFRRCSGLPKFQQGQISRRRVVLWSIEFRKLDPSAGVVHCQSDGSDTERAGSAALCSSGVWNTGTVQHQTLYWWWGYTTEGFPLTNPLISDGGRDSDRTRRRSSCR